MVLATEIIWEEEVIVSKRKALLDFSNRAFVMY